MAFVSQLPTYQTNTDSGIPIPTTSNPNSYPDQGALSQAAPPPQPQWNQVQQPGLLSQASGGSLPQGIDKSWVEGYLAQKQLNFSTDENSRANSQQTINEEKEGFDRYNFQRQAAIQSGMAQAAHQGGFNGVVDYLQSADPAMAMQFSQAKTSLDKSIMENQTYQYAHENDKNQVMLQGYQMLGGIGATLMKTPQNQQAATYQALLPIAKQIDPSLPETLNMDAVAKLGMGMALSTPAAILYDYSKQYGMMQGDYGKALMDHQVAVNMFGANSAQAQQTSQAAQGILDKQQNNNLTTANTVSQSQTTGEQSMKTMWNDTVSKPFVTSAQLHQQAHNALNQNITYKDGVKGPDDMNITVAYLHTIDPTMKIRPGQIADAENTEGWTDKMRTMWNNAQKGDRLGEDVRKSMIQVIDNSYNMQQKAYNSQKSEYRKIAIDRNYNPDHIISDEADSYLPQPSAKTIQILQQNINDPQARNTFQMMYGQNALNNIITPPNIVQKQ